MHNRNLVLRHGKTTDDAFVAVHQVFVVQGRALLNQRIHQVNLTAFGDLIFQKLKHPQSGCVGAVHGLDGLPARRQFVQHAGVQIPVRRHGQRPWNGGRRHHQDVRSDLRFLPKLGALGDPKAVLLVDDGQAQPVEHHLGFNQRVGPHQNVHLSRLQGLQNLTSRTALHRSRQKFHAHGHVSKHLPQPFEVLLGQNLGGRHDRRLEPVVFGQQRGQQRNHRFAAAHVALKQAVHVAAGVQIGPNLPQHPLLGARQLEGELLMEELVEGLADQLKPNARQVLGDLVLVLKQAQLEQKQLFKAQPGLGRLRVFRTLGAVDQPHGLSPSQQLHLGHHAGGQRFGQGRGDLRHHVSNELGQPCAVQPLAGEFLRARIHRAQPIAASQFKLAQELHLRMGDAPFAFVQFGLAVNDHLLLHRQVAHDPLGSAKPLKLHRALPVVEHGHQATPSAPAHFVGPGDHALHLHRDMFPLDVADAHELAAVLVPEWQVQDKVHAGPQPKLRNKGVGPFGPDAFEKFKGGGWTHICHVMASYVRPPVRPTSRPDSPSFASPRSRTPHLSRRPPRGGRSSR